MNNLPRCFTCKWMCLKDYGYSDYTVEGTLVDCLKGRFREYEKPFEDEKNIGYIGLAARCCNFYSYGVPLELNVDCNQQQSIDDYITGMENH